MRLAAARAAAGQAGAEARVGGADALEGLGGAGPLRLGPLVRMPPLRPPRAPMNARGHTNRYTGNKPTAHGATLIQNWGGRG